ncbi:hypothetical protein [Pleomorphomonas sp. PLEO]
MIAIQRAVGAIAAAKGLTMALASIPITELFGTFTALALAVVGINGRASS